MHATFAELYIYIQFLLHDFSLLRSLSLRLPIRENKTDTFLKRYFYFSSEQNWSTQVKGKSVIYFALFHILFAHSHTIQHKHKDKYIYYWNVLDLNLKRSRLLRLCTKSVLILHCEVLVAEYIVS